MSTITDTINITVEDSTKIFPDFTRRLNDWHLERCTDFKIVNVFLNITFDSLVENQNIPQILKTGKNPVWTKKPDAVFVGLRANHQSLEVIPNDMNKWQEALPKIRAAKDVSITATATYQYSNDREITWLYQVKK